MDAQVDRGQLVDAELAEVRLDVGAQFVGLRGRDPVALVVAAGADLADTSARFVGVRVQRLADQFVGDVGAVELRGVDVVDAEFDGALQHGDRLVVVARRAEDAGSGQLHGAEADAVDGELAEWECASCLHPTRERGAFNPNAPLSVLKSLVRLLGSRRGSGRSRGGRC